MRKSGTEQFTRRFFVDSRNLFIQKAPYSLLEAAKFAKAALGRTSARRLFHIADSPSGTSDGRTL